MAKITKDIVFQLLVVLALASACLCHQCSDNCFYCFGDGKCGSCYKRKVISGPGGTRHVCSSQPAPASDNCLVYGEDGCNQCLEGWAVNLSTFKCVKSTIKDCVNENVLGSKHICYSCLEGYPNKNRTSCIPKSQVKKVIPNCKVGGISGVGGGLVCEQCVPGYVSAYQSCYKNLPFLKGCLLTNLNICQVCDAQNGYFMRDYARCSKNGSVLLKKV